MKVVSRLNLDSFEPGFHKLWFNVVTDNIGNSITIPVIIIKTKKKGPTVTINSLIHGDELNGLDVVHTVLKRINLLKGTLIVLPVFNVPGFLNNVRYFEGSIDLNHYMPGKAKGKIFEMYINRIFTKVILHSDYLFDLHTARKGSLNVYYLRANLENPKVKEFANLLNSRLILNHVPTPTTLRGACEVNNIPCICLELGNPLRYQKSLVEEATVGLMNVLDNLGMVKTEVKTSKPIICSSSYRIVSEESGIAEIYPKLLERVSKGELIGNLKNVFGDVLHEFVAKEDGVVIGKLSNPIIKAGAKILHVGVTKQVQRTLK